MRKYECTFIINPEKEEKAEDITDKIKDYIEKKKGKVLDIDNWGIKKLSYEISGYEDGLYTVTNFEFDPKKIDKLNEYLHKNQDILRFIIVVKEE